MTLSGPLERMLALQSKRCDKPRPTHSSGVEGTLLGVRATWSGWDVVLLLVGLAGAVVPLVVQAELARKAAVSGRRFS